MAYVYWRETMGGPLVMNPYFQPDAMASRARSAFSRLSPAGAMARVESIRTETLTARMQSPRATEEFALSDDEAVPVNEGAAEAQPSGD